MIRPLSTALRLRFRESDSPVRVTCGLIKTRKIEDKAFDALLGSSADVDAAEDMNAAEDPRDINQSTDQF